MISYLDTSLVVTALTNERRTGDVLKWLGAQPAGTLAISEWVVTEFSAALSVKQRMGTLDPISRAATLNKFKDFLSTGIDVLIVASAHFRSAAAIADQSTLGLRAGDALNLAVASDNGAALHTLDQRLAAAGPALGIRTVLL